MMKTLARMMMVLGIFNFVFTACNVKKDNLDVNYLEEVTVAQTLYNDLEMRIKNIEFNDRVQYDYFNCQLIKTIENKEICAILSGVDMNFIGNIYNRRFSYIPVGYLCVSNKIVIFSVYLSSPEHSFIFKKEEGENFILSNQLINDDKVNDDIITYYEKFTFKPSSFGL